MSVSLDNKDNYEHSETKFEFSETTDQYSEVAAKVFAKADVNLEESQKQKKIVAVPVKKFFRVSQAKKNIPHFITLLHKPEEPQLNKGDSSILPLASWVVKLRGRGKKNIDHKELETQFKDKGKVFGTERCVRCDTVTVLEKNCKDKIQRLNKEIEEIRREISGYEESIDKILDFELSGKISDLERKITQLKEQIRTAERNLTNIEKKRENSKDPRKMWVGSSDAREILRQLKKIKKNLINQAAFKRAAEEILPAPVNLRVHSFENTQQEKVAFLRSGALSDLRNGFWDLGTAREILMNGDSPRSDREVEKRLEEKRAELEQTLKKLKSPEQIASAQYALGQLSSAKAFRAAYNDRKTFLEDQMLQFVMTQIQANRSKLNENQPFNMVVLSLLNPQKQEVDASGWAHYERNQALDFKSIAEVFDGKEIVFEGDQAYFDGEKVYLPSSLLDNNEPPEDITLNIAFLNNSVQSHEENDDFKSKQKALNEEGFKKLKAMVGPESPQEVKDLLQKIQIAFDEGRSDYWVAEDLGLLALKLNSALSVHCASGKDRTGFVCARITQRLLAQEIVKDAEEKDEKKKEKLIQKFATDIFNKDNIASKVVQDCMPELTVVKTNPRKLPGFTEGFKPKLKRDLYYVEQTKQVGLAVVKSKIKDATNQ